MRQLNVIMKVNLLAVTDGASRSAAWYGSLNITSIATTTNFRDIDESVSVDEVTSFGSLV